MHAAVMAGGGSLLGFVFCLCPLKWPVRFVMCGQYILDDQSPVIRAVVAAFPGCRDHLTIVAL